jgi:hypothetical protein
MNGVLIGVAARPFASRYSRRQPNKLFNAETRRGASPPRSLFVKLREVLSTARFARTLR